MRVVALFFGLCVSLPALAHALKFAQPVTVTSAGKGVFFHLESSGRTSLAVADGTVAITWEDNRSGTPQVYAAFKRARATGFGEPMQVSTTGPAYEPTIAAIGDKFIVGWEAQDHLWLRVLSLSQQGKPMEMVTNSARQLSLVSTGDKVSAVWAERDTTPYHIRTAQLRVHDLTASIHAIRDVDSSSDRKEQLYPSLAVTKHGMVVAWEDRRAGVTHIVTAFAPTGKAFTPQHLLNHFKPPPNPALGRGTGAMRVVLSSDGVEDVIAVWLDKRDFVEGYDVYAAISSDSGKTFGDDEKAQDSMGNNIPQWHATVAMSRSGHMVAAWDDNRDGSSDVWYSTRESIWSDDNTWPGGNGEGAQTQPVLLFEGELLHAAWLEQRGDKVSIRYIKALLQ